MERKAPKKKGIHTMLTDYELNQLQDEWDEQQIVDAVQSEEFESMDYDERAQALFDYYAAECLADVA